MQWQPMTDVAPTTTPQRAAAIRARLLGTPPRKVVKEIEVPAEPQKPKIVFKFVPPPEITQHDAHVFAWYKKECDRLSKEVSALEYLLSAYRNSGGNRVYVDEIIDKMCEHYGVSKRDIKSDRRTRDIVFPRQKMMWIAKKMTHYGLPHIGRVFGDRDHTTVLHAVRKIDALIASNDPSVADLKGWLND
jgi:hypothetical protein